MDVIHWYMSFFFGVLAVLGLYRSWLLLLKFCSRQLTYVFTRRLQYPLLLQRRYWSAVTRLQALCISFYVIANVTVIALAWGDIREVEKRAAVAAVTNLTPIFLGGRTNPLTDAMGMSLSSYYLAHHWIGRVAIAEALLHSIMVLTLRPRLGPVSVSGVIASISLFSILISSLYVFRRGLGDSFRLIHGLLALGVLAGALWHIFVLNSVSAKVLICVAPILWFLTTTYRLVVMLYRGTGARIDAVWEYGNATQVEVHTKRPIRAVPGNYFYISFPGSIWYYDIAHSYPMVATWYEPSELSSNEGVRNMAFIISHKGRHFRHTKELEVGQNILLEGPYGNDLQLQTYENVILVAKGIGILGLLPFALHLAERSEHDDHVRRSLEEWPTRVEEWSNRKKEWEEMNSDLSAEEAGFLARRESITGQRQVHKAVLDALEKDGKWLKKARRRLDEQGELLKQERATMEKEKGIASSTPLFRDATRHVDLFWALDHNSQFKWASDYLKALKKLDPHNKLLVFWGDFPTPLPIGAKPPFRDSDYWLCLYPDRNRQSFSEMVLSTIEKEADSPGRTVVVGCGDAGFTKEMRDGVIEITRPDLMVEFVEAEYQPRNNMSLLTNKQRSDDLAAVASEADSCITLSDEKENKERSYIARTRTIAAKKSKGKSTPAKGKGTQKQPALGKGKRAQAVEEEVEDVRDVEDASEEEDAGDVAEDATEEEDAGDVAEDAAEEDASTEEEDNDGHSGAEDGETNEEHEDEEMEWNPDTGFDDPGPPKKSNNPSAKKAKKDGKQSTWGWESEKMRQAYPMKFDLPIRTKNYNLIELKGDQDGKTTKEKTTPINGKILYVVIRGYLMVALRSKNKANPGLERCVLAKGGTYKAAKQAFLAGGGKQVATTDASYLEGTDWQDFVVNNVATTWDQRLTIIEGYTKLRKEMKLFSVSTLRQAFEPAQVDALILVRRAAVGQEDLSKKKKKVLPADVLQYLAKHNVQMEG